MQIHAEVLAVRRWDDLNEYEGELRLRLSGPGLEVTCYAMLNARRWAALTPGQPLEGDLTLLALGGAQPSGQPAGLHDAAGVNVTAVGPVEAVTSEGLTLRIAPDLDLEVDLDGHEADVPPGQVAGVRGQLTLDLA